MKKLSLSRFTDFITEVDSIDSRVTALAESLKDRDQSLEPWVYSELANILIECVGRRKMAEVFFLGRDEEGLIGVSDGLAAAEIARLEVECPDNGDDK